MSDDFWKLGCRKSICRYGAKHMSKLKCTNHLSIGRLLEIKMSKKCMPLWREVRLEVNIYKIPHVRAIFRGRDIQKVYVISKSKNLNHQDSDHF